MKRATADTAAERAPTLGPFLARALLDSAPAASGDGAATALTAAERALLAALIERIADERSLGNVCLPLATLTVRSGDDDAAWPALTDLRRLLQKSGLCQLPTMLGPLPLVLDAQDRLYLRRDFEAEATIAAHILPRTAPMPGDGDAVRRAIAAAGIAVPPDGIDWQLAAIVAAAHAPFLLLTGGPGTGKTTTVARALAVLWQQAPQLRVAIAAPTGKAAARLGEALAQRAGADPALGARPTPVPTTLHRLLGYLPLEDAFRHGPDLPLPFDLVVVDETSMVDPALLACLCRALPEQAKLWLVGDRDQLDAIGAGQVLGDLCRAAAPERGVGSDLAAFAAATLGMALPIQPHGSPLANCTIALRQNHRFDEKPGISAFAAAMQQRQGLAAMAALTNGGDDLQIAADPQQALQALAARFVTAARADTKEAALATLATVRVLTATKSGSNGAAAWNARIEALLRERGLRIEPPWYPGRPVLVTANDHGNRLWNGDLGVTFREANGRLVVLFAAADGSVRAVPPLRLPAHETAFAMTIHKAQGSEFDDVLVAMPDRDGPLWQAPLLYTAITRARKRAIVLADRQLLAIAVGRWPTRASGLAARFAAVERNRLE
jgi:exodeoxyribonuclease V alpha subunit